AQLLFFFRRKRFKCFEKRRDNPFPAQKPNPELFRFFRRSWTGRIDLLEIRLNFFPHGAKIINPSGNRWLFAIFTAEWKKDGYFTNHWILRQQSVWRRTSM